MQYSPHPYLHWAFCSPVLMLQFGVVNKLLRLVTVLLYYFEMRDNINYDPAKREKV